ncbi:MAG: hypothetical protein H7201_02735 [Candidatus Saccharibacteria bacterium]|nr:hypothetical protein [Microbacteriaceae bacterium]
MLDPGLAFYYTKGLVALASTIGLLWFMHHTWFTADRHGGHSQRARLITLFYFVSVITYVSVSQVNSDPLPAIDQRSVLSLGGAILTAYTIFISVKECLNRKV